MRDIMDKLEEKECYQLCSWTEGHRRVPPRMKNVVRLLGKLGEEYKVHVTDSLYRASHLDSTVLCLRPGLVLLNSKRANPNNLPEIFKSWDKICFKDRNGKG